MRLPAQPGSDIAQHLQPVSWFARARQHPWVFDLACHLICGDAVTRDDGYLRQGRVGSHEVAAGGLAWLMAIIGPGRLRPIGAGYDLNWLPQPHRFAYALR